MNHVEQILTKSLEIHKKKREDYTSKPDVNPYENFTRANEIVSWFPSDYKSFASHIGTKLARLASLLESGRTPNNESIDDSFLDLVTYCALMYGFYKSQNLPSGSYRAAELNAQYNPEQTIRKCNHINVSESRVCYQCCTNVSELELAMNYLRTMTGFVRKFDK